MIAITLAGDTAVLARLSKAALRVPDSVAREVQVQVFGLVAVVKKDKLSGQVLKRRSGRLSRSVNGQVTRTPVAVSGSVGTNLAYGRAHERGFDGVVTVKAHLRTIKQAFGRPIPERRVAVAAHSMHLRLPERSFLRSALREQSPKIQAALDAAVRAAVA